MEEIIKSFLDLLQVKGGDLGPEKCVWYLISHRWKDGKPRLLQSIVVTVGSTYSQDQLTQSQVSIVRRKAPNEVHRTLGFFMTGDGTCSSYKKEMTEKASLYATHIQRSSVWKGESGLAYNSFYLPIVRVWKPSDNPDSARMLQHPEANTRLRLQDIFKRAAPHNV
jgi:hypothetical protein